MKGHIAVDLDRTLARYDKWRGEFYIGEPIKPMVERVKKWLKEGVTVKIFTARVSLQDKNNDKIRKAIEDWCEKNIGQKLEITNEKDYNTLELWDDRAVQIIPNTGLTFYDLNDKILNDLLNYKFNTISKDTYDKEIKRIFKKYEKYFEV